MSDSNNVWNSIIQEEYIVDLECIQKKRDIRLKYLVNNSSVSLVPSILDTSSVSDTKNEIDEASTIVPAPVTKEVKKKEKGQKKMKEPKEKKQKEPKEKKQNEPKEKKQKEPKEPKEKKQKDPNNRGRGRPKKEVQVVDQKTDNVVQADATTLVV